MRFDQNCQFSKILAILAKLENNYKEFKYEMKSYSYLGLQLLEIPSEREFQILFAIGFDQIGKNKFSFFNWFVNINIKIILLDSFF